MKRFLVILAALCVVVSMTATAQNAVAPAADKAVAAAPAADLTLTGKIAKVEPKMEGGKATFTLVTKDGKIALPETKAEVADLAKMVGKDVKIVAKGTEKMDGDKKVVKVDSIVKVEEVPAAPAVTK